MIAIREAYRAGLLGRKHWLSNLGAGLVVAVVALPLSMAFAIASGAKPEQGLYTAVVAGLVVSLFGGSRVQIGGPTGAFVVILAAITAKYGLAGLQAATLMAGIILLLLGAARLGGIIKYIPTPVVLGFTAGIGVIIWMGQWSYFFGLPNPPHGHFFQKTWAILESLPRLNLPTTYISLACLAVLIVAPKVAGLRRIPPPLLVLVGSTAAMNVWRWEGVATIGTTFGEFPQGLPSFSLPDVSWPTLLTLIGPAFTIAMLGAIESLLSAMVSDSMASTRHDANQELIGQGLANLLAPLFGGFAATGAITRTATSVRNGGNSPLAGLFHVAALVGVLVALAPLAVNVPLAALAAILWVVAYNMSELHRVAHVVRTAPRADSAIMLITFGLTVMTDLVVAVNIGVILATLHFLRRMAASVEVAHQSGDQLEAELAAAGLSQLPPGVVVYAIEGPFFFGAVETFERALAISHTDPQGVIIRLKWVPFMDGTALDTLMTVADKLTKRGVRVMLSGANSLVAAKLEKAGLVERLGRQNVFATFDLALKGCAQPPQP